MPSSFDIKALKRLKRIAREARPEPVEITRKQYEKILEETKAVDMTNGAQNVLGLNMPLYGAVHFKVKD